MEHGAYLCQESEASGRLAGIFFLCGLWEMFPVSENLANSVLTEVRRAVRGKSKLLKLSVMGRLFQLLFVFSGQN